MNTAPTAPTASAPVDPNTVIPPLSHVEPIKPGYGVRIDIEFDGPVDPDVAHVLGKVTAKAFAAMTKPAFVRALVELI